MPTVQKEKEVTDDVWMPMEDVPVACGISRMKLRDLMLEGVLETRKTRKDLRYRYVNVSALQRYLDEPV
jgi:hypothetical protein